MIILEIDGYCDNCLDFLADVKKPERMEVFDMKCAYDGEQYHYTDTIIRCANRKRCEAIKRYLEREVKDVQRDSK